MDQTPIWILKSKFAAFEWAESIDLGNKKM